MEKSCSRVRPRAELWCISSFPRRKRSPMEKKITVLLVDDHSLVRRGFRRMLEDEADMDVIGEAGNGEEAIQLAKELTPQVVVMDCALPGMNGLQATRQIMDNAPSTAVLMLSMHTESTWVHQAVEAGAKGYIL